MNRLIVITDKVVLKVRDWSLITGRWGGGGGGLQNGKIAGPKLFAHFISSFAPIGSDPPAIYENYYSVKLPVKYYDIVKHEGISCSYRKGLTLPCFSNIDNS